MKNQKLQEYFELSDDDQLIDVKLSLGNITSAPSEILAQVKEVVRADRDGMLNDFVDF